MNNSLLESLFGMLILLSIPGAIAVIALTVYAFNSSFGDGTIMATHIDSARYCDECGRRCLGERCVCEGHTHVRIIKKPYHIAR